MKGKKAKAELLRRLGQLHHEIWLEREKTNQILELVSDLAKQIDKIINSDKAEAYPL